MTSESSTRRKLALAPPLARLYAAPRLASSAERTRLLGAGEQLVCELGPERFTVAGVCERAGVSRRTFYAAFENAEQCLLAVFDEVCARAAAEMCGAYRAANRWVEGVRGALAALLALLDERPRLGRFLLVASLAGPPSLLARRRETLTRLADVLAATCPLPARGAPPAPFGAEAVVGAVASILHARVREEPVPPLKDMCNPLMAAIVLPYLDSAAARRELLRAPADAQ